jgi:exonuclease VII small subunit
MENYTYLDLATALLGQDSQKDVATTYNIPTAKLSTIKPVLTEYKEETNRLQQSIKELEQVKAKLQDSIRKLEQSESKLEQSNKELEQVITNLELRIKELEQSNKELEQVITTSEVIQTTENVGIISSNPNGLFYNFLEQVTTKYFGMLSTGNIIVTMVNTLECVSLFSCCLYLLPNLFFGITIGTVLISLLWYVQYIVKNPKYIYIVDQYLGIAGVITLLSCATHYATIMKLGGIYIPSVIDKDLSIIVAIIMPCCSFIALWLRNRQMTED